MWLEIDPLLVCSPLLISFCASIFYIEKKEVSRVWQFVWKALIGEYLCMTHKVKTGIERYLLVLVWLLWPNLLFFQYIMPWMLVSRDTNIWLHSVASCCFSEYKSSINKIKTANFPTLYDCNLSMFRGVFDLLFPTKTKHSFSHYTFCHNWVMAEIGSHRLWNIGLPWQSLLCRE